MKPFENTTHNKNEKAIRKGRVVPEGDVNLAYVRAPELSPKENVVIVDTSRIVEENISSGTNRCKLYYANPLGVLVDEDDNVAISDEYPVVTDVFSVDEDFSVLPGSEYTDEDILPFMHTSRYFHLDYAGLVMGGDRVNYEHEAVKVVDGQGNEYGNYRIKIIPVYIKAFDEENLTNTGGTFPASTWAYRVFAYVDTDSHGDLYLTYNKIEVEDDGKLVRREIGYREALNPSPFFSYTPEESEVVDPANREKKIYSSKPITYKQNILGEPVPNVDGYRVYVPKKAVGDPRIYQLFRWRVKCNFTQEVTVDPSRDFQTVNCGVIVTSADLANNTPSRAPYALLNLSRSRYNASGVMFRNPAQPNHDPGDQERRDYWFVNIDTDDISQYDLLIWAPQTHRFDFSPYAGKINDFVANHGGTLFFDSNTWADPKDSLGGRTSVPFHPTNGTPRITAEDGASTIRGRADDPRWRNTSHPLLDGNTQLGGWVMTGQTGINNPMIDYMSYTQLSGRKYTQHFGTAPPGYSALLQVKLDGTSNTWRTVTAVRKVNSGHKIYSTFGHLFTCSALFSYIDNKLLTGNAGVRISKNQDYSRHINGVGIEGAMKLLYNAALLAVRGRALDSSDQEQFSTSWAYYTPWRSSWVIDASDDVLSQREKSDHDFLIDAQDIHAEPPDTTPVWKRRLSNRTIRQLVDEAIAPIMDNPGTRIRVEGSAREYEIEVTNPYVYTGSKVIENDYPHAWTDAFTPKFTVPTELGPHIVKEETDSSGVVGRVAQYDDATYVHREYPEKPYAGQVTATYVATEEIAQTNDTGYIATGTAVGTIRISTTTPARTTSKTSNVSLSWWDSQVATRSSATRGGPLDPSGTMWNRNTNNPRAHPGLVKPVGIMAWQDRNYYTNDWGPGHLCFPYWGHTSRLVRGSSGDRVRFLQEAINRIIRARYISGTILSVDGQYGPATQAAVRNFQTKINARWVDGVVDAETWSLIGIQIHRLASEGKLGTVNSNNYTQWFGWHDRVQPHRMSNGNSNWIAKRSWVRNGPTIIWDMYAIRFRETYNFHGVTMRAYVPGAHDRMMFRSIHVGNNTDLRNFNSRWSQVKWMPHRPRSGDSIYVPMGPYRGNTITIGVGQDKSSGWGSARAFGIRDIRGHTRITTTTTIPSTTVVTYQQEDINFTVTGNTSVESFKDKVIQLQTPKWNNYHSVSNIRFTGITVSNPEVVASITRDGKATFSSQIVSVNAGTEILKGQAFPATGFNYHSMDEEGRFNPVPETGWVSKADGIKLLCDDKKKPVGFPGLPTNVGTNEAQRHYVKLALGTTGTDSSVQMGFYDYSQKEFITSIDGKPEISFIEYLKRGPHNIYIAVISDYEKASDEVIPVDDDAPRLPYRWAMPVYGVCTKAGSKITLESLPDRLGPHDIWPIAVREGQFVRDVSIRPRWEGGLTGYLQGHQGTRVQAFYAIPEASIGGYSLRYGPPNADIIDEEPIVVDDDVLQVRQAPILMVQHPTIYPNEADPVRPVVTLYKRATRNSPWVKQPFSVFKDYNASTGELILRQRLTSDDAGLLRVDYTTTRRHYRFKRDGDMLLNLNSYSGHTRDLVGEAIYVYIVPHYVKDSSGVVIPGSHQDRTLRVSLHPRVFDPLQPEYDPLAIQLGVVYISTALDIERLAILDTRRRGGGIVDSANVREVERLVNDSVAYWDMGYAAGSSYQKSGYIVIRLPDYLRNHFTENEIIKVVKRNVGAGVGFKLENLQGEDWS